jgi:hypothetical protein
MQLVLAEVAWLGILLRSACLGAEVCLRRVHLVDNLNERRVVSSGPEPPRNSIWKDLLAYSSTIFFFARSRTSSSMVSLLTKRYTLTWDFCPIR